MATQELAKPSLTGQIREQVRLNQENGDRKSHNGNSWCSYGRGIEIYEESFSGVLNGSISDLLKNRPFPVVIDLMAPSEAVATLFERFPDKSKLGLAVSLEDLRSDSQKERDKGLNVEQIAGDILKPSTWNEIEKKLQGHKADLIMERALSGLEILPLHPKLYAILLNKAWQILSSKKGIMLLQIPFHELLLEIGINVQDFERNLKMKGIKTEFFGLEAVGNSRLVLKITKTPNSPEKLPFLT